MITIFGIGTAGKNIAKLFSSHKNYNIFSFTTQEEDEVGHFQLRSSISPEKCEENIPDLSRIQKEVSEKIQVFLCGSSFSSNYALGILEQFKDRKVEIFYIKPDADMLVGNKKLQEKVIFAVLQQYARSGLFDSITILSNPVIEQHLGNVPIKTYYQTINQTIYYVVHYLNYFNNNEPLIGNSKETSEIQRIRTIGFSEHDRLSEKLFYQLDNQRDVSYIFCINKDKLEKDGELHRNITSKLKQKPRNAYKNISYSIYESHDNKDYGFCIALTNVVQESE